MLSNYPTYTLVLELPGVKLYTPVNVADYHITRYIEALRYQTYAAAGLTPEFLQKWMTELITRANKEKRDETFRTDVAAIANTVLYCTKYPIDQHNTMRLGCMLSFIETPEYCESPEKVELFFQSKKEELAHSNPKAYDFFLQLGMKNMQNYKDWSEALSDLDYSKKREEMIKSLLPQ